jgi:hypothetical protein
MIRAALLRTLSLSASYDARLGVFSAGNISRSQPQGILVNAFASEAAATKSATKGKGRPKKSTKASKDSDELKVCAAPCFDHAI